MGYGTPARLVPLRTLFPNNVLGLPGIAGIIVQSYKV